jgi:hypothetical protein
MGKEIGREPPTFALSICRIINMRCRISSYSDCVSMRILGCSERVGDPDIVNTCECFRRTS